MDIILNGGLPELVEDEDGIAPVSLEFTSSNCWSEGHWKGVGRCMEERKTLDYWLFVECVEPKGFPGVYRVALIGSSRIWARMDVYLNIKIQGRAQVQSK